MFRFFGKKFHFNEFIFALPLWKSRKGKPHLVTGNFDRTVFLQSSTRKLVPNERLHHIDQFNDTNLPGVMITTLTLVRVSCGTELNAVQEGIPKGTPTESCYLGWQESLAQLVSLVEPEMVA